MRARRAVSQGVMEALHLAWRAWATNPHATIYISARYGAGKLADICALAPGLPMAKVVVLMERGAR